MEQIQNSSSKGTPQGCVFSLENIHTSPKKAKYIPPRVKVINLADLSTHQNIKWFMDSYNFEGVYQNDLHLYVKQEGQMYGDMGFIVNAKEDLNEMAMPCIVITIVPKGETTKATDISLLLNSWAPFDMTGSKQGKENSFGKIGISIANFSSVKESGVDSYAQLVKGMQNAKGVLCPGGKKITGSRKANTTKQDRKTMQNQGRDFVKSAIVQMATQEATSSQKPLPQVQGTKDQGGKQKSGRNSEGKRSMPKEVIDNENKQKRQKQSSSPSSLQLAVVNPSQNQSPSSSSLQLAVVNPSQNQSPSPSSSQLAIVNQSSSTIEANQNKALALLETQKAYYPFGSDAIFSIDVLKCFPAPANYVYRRLNKDWVKMLTSDLIKDTKFMEILAIVMPCTDDRMSPLQTLSNENISKATYWIISGQHSICAAKRIQKSTSPKVTPQLKAQFRYRKCKIVLNCPAKISRDISKDANISVAKSMQTEPFLDQLLQARSQWIANGRPSKPPPGVNTTKVSSKSWEDFVETTEHTLHKGFVKNDLHLLLCEDIIWNNWVSIMDSYVRGGLPNTKGITIAPTIAKQTWSSILKLKHGKIQQATGTVMLGPTLFRCIAGLQMAEVLNLQTALLNKSILLKKSKHTKDMIDMEEYAWNLKVDRVLQVAIIDFYSDLTKEMQSWDQLCEKYKLGSYEYNQLKSYTEVFVKDCLNRSKKKPSLPSSAVTLLHHLYRATMDTMILENSMPWAIKGVGLDTQKLELLCQQSTVPFQLAIMDARGFGKDLSMENFCSITKCLNAMNSRMEYIFICFVDFIKIGCLVEGVRAQSGKVHYEVGAITNDNEQYLTTGVLAFASVILFVSKGNAFESIDKAPGGEKVFMSASVSARGDKIDADFLLRLIEGFSPQQNYVLDLFSGGTVLQQSLLSKRRCIALCKDDLEAMTLEAKCSQILEDNPFLQEWFGPQESSHNKVDDFDNADKNELDDIDIDDQPSGDDRDDEENSKRHESSSSDDDKEEEVNIRQMIEDEEVVNTNLMMQVSTIQTEEVHKEKEKEVLINRPEEMFTFQADKVSTIQREEMLPFFPKEVHTAQPQQVNKVQLEGVHIALPPHENQQCSSSNEEVETSGAKKINISRNEEEEEASFVHQGNDEKEGEEDKLNKDNDNVEESSQIGRLII